MKNTLSSPVVLSPPVVSSATSRRFALGDLFGAPGTNRSLRRIAIALKLAIVILLIC